MLQIVMQRQGQTMKQYYDLKVKQQEFHVNEWMMDDTPTKVSYYDKWTWKYNSPYLVVDWLGHT
jgi:hypothetical protein